MVQNVLQFIEQHKVIAIARGILSADMPKLVRAMLDGGVRCVEVTFDQSSEERQRDTLRSIRGNRDACGGTGAAGA